MRRRHTDTRNLKSKFFDEVLGFSNYTIIRSREKSKSSHKEKHKRKRDTKK